MIIRKGGFIICMAMGFLVKTTSAQQADIGNWFIYFGSQKISSKWNWWNEAQYRNYNFAGDLQQLLLRTGIGYDLTAHNNNILLGYGFIHTENYVTGTNDKKSNSEHRIYQQFITRQQFSRVSIQHRYRVEERFLPGDFQVRMRYFLSFNIPFNKKSMEAKAFYASLYNEIFLNAQQTIFDRNRLFGGIGYVFNKYFRAEIGFMAQTLQHTNRNQFQVILFNSLPFHKED